MSRDRLDPENRRKEGEWMPPNKPERVEKEQRRGTEKRQKVSGILGLPVLLLVESLLQEHSYFF